MANNRTGTSTREGSWGLRSVLHGVGYWRAPHSYQVRRPRLRTATVLASGAEHYVDAGPGKRVWAFTMLALDDLVRYDGKPTGRTGQEYRDSLAASYDTIGVLPFVDPHGVAWPVRFDHLTECLPDPRSALTGLRRIMARMMPGIVGGLGNNFGGAAPGAECVTMDASDWGIGQESNSICKRCTTETPPATNP